jgi:nitroimidazol reductase NimA-like FMN-containing flavoprotein (pyridoxamine 5'-phosphate oxidase superfamily)
LDCPFSLDWRSEAYQLSAIIRGMTTQQRLASRTHVRRNDRAVKDDAWIGKFLEQAPFGVMATVDGRQPYINSNIFVYVEDERVIYMHSARGGRTAANTGEPARTCFSVSEMGRLLPADSAFSMSVEYAGVAVFGTAQLLSDDAERRHALSLLVRKYFPHLNESEHYRAPSADEMALTAVYRIDIEEWSGKRKTGEPDHAGAFTYPYAPSDDSPPATG